MKPISNYIVDDCFGKLIEQLDKEIEKLENYIEEE